MPLPIVNSIASWFLKKRIHQIDLFLKYPIDVQDELLKGLIHKAKSTEIGNRYDFRSINNYQDFAERVPVTSYEDNRIYYMKGHEKERAIFFGQAPIKWFAKSSGTTNARSKFLPVSNRIL